MTNTEVYKEKKQFVQELSGVLSRYQLADKIEYKGISKHYTEYVRVIYLGGRTEYINVTGDSLRSIFIEISRVINRQAAVGAVADMRMQEMIERWWSEEI